MGDLGASFWAAARLIVSLDANLVDSVGRSLWLSIWGKATVPDPNGAPSGDALLASVKIGLQIGIDTSTRTQTEVQVLNTPDVSGL